MVNEIEILKQQLAAANERAERESERAQAWVAQSRLFEDKLDAARDGWKAVVGIAAPILETLAAQIAEKPYTEISAGLQATITDGVRALRAIVARFGAQGGAE